MLAAFRRRQTLKDFNMATEGVLLHDGTQCVAAANYSNTAALLGQGGSAQFYLVGLTAAGRTVAIASVAGQACYGVLQNKPTLGAPADVGVIGPSKVLAGGTIAAGAKIMASAAGVAVAWVAGAGNQQVGVAIEAAVNGQIFTAYIFGPGAPSLLT